MRFIYYLWENATQHHLNVLQKYKLGENETLGPTVAKPTEMSGEQIRPH